MSSKIILMFIYSLINRDIKIWVQGKDIKLFVPDGVSFTDEEKKFITLNKEKIFNCLKKNQVYSKEYDYLLLRDDSNRGILSFAQERLWFVDQYEEGTSAYNIPIIFKILDHVDPIILESSIRDIVERHEILRTVLEEDSEGCAYQVVKDLGEKPLEIKKIEIKTRLTLENKINKEISHVYDLKNEYPLRVCLYKLSKISKKNKPEYYLSIVIHHIAFDAWSINIFLRELEAYYIYHISQSKGLKYAPNLPELSIQYKDFAIWQRYYLSGERLDKQLTYWKHKLDGHETLNLVADKARPSWAAYAGANAYFEISESISTKLRELAKQLKVSLYSLLLAGYYLMLRVYSNQNDIVIGIPIANRHYNQIDNLIGFFVNTLALRTKIEPSALVRKYIQEIGREIIEAQLHQDLPFEKLVEELEVGKDTSRHPIFQVVFAMEGPDQKTQQQTYEPPKSSLINSLQPYTLKRNMHTVAKFDLSTFIDDNQISLKGCFNYAESLYTKVTVSRYIKTYTEILNKLSNLANNIKKQEQMKISDLSYLNEMQHHQIIYKWNATEKAFPEDKTLQKLFEEQAEQTPNNIAVVHNKIYLTYKELNERANQLANYVKILYELKPDTLIVICLDKSEFMLIAILGVLKAGGAYVPMDPTDPDERLHYILKDTSTKIILTNKKYKRRFERILSKGNNLKNREVDEGVGKKKQQLATILELDESELQEKLLMQSKNNPETTVSSNLLAYVMYTSGTTGIPKGAMIEHKSTVSLIKNVAYINITPKDTFIQFSNIAFDAAVFEIWAALLNGAKLIVPSNKVKLNNIEYFYKNLIKEKISILWLTKTLFDQFYLIKPEIFKNIKYLLVGGEELNKELIFRLKNSEFSPENIINGYGPTENATFSCTLNISKYFLLSSKPIPIGKPLTNRTAYVLDAYLNPVPIGAIGELYVGGAGLARGYLNKPELTAERFIPNPFQIEREKKNNKNTRLYKTGDLARWLLDGNLEYIGRNDFQVKIRGYRIELGEIENVLSSYEGITQSVVLAKEHVNPESSGSKYLVGYYVSEGQLNEKDILSYLSDKLPEYMIPSILVHLDKLPLTFNGKLDRNGLPKLELTNRDTYIEPKNELERKVRQIWSEVLGLPEDKISAHDDFFRLGGDSIVSIQLVSKIRKKLGFLISIKDIFVYKSIESLCDNVLAKKIGKNNIQKLKAEQGILSGCFSLLPIQEWFFKNCFAKSNHWNQSFIIKTPTLDLDKLCVSIDKLVAYHDVFRLRYKKIKKGESISNIQFYGRNARKEELKVLDIRNLMYKESSTDFTLELYNILTDWQNNFDLKNGPIYNISYIYGYSDGSARIVFSLHHLIVDVVSWKILTDDLKNIYNGKELGPKGSSYRQWVNTVKNYANFHPSEKIYWLNLLSNYKNVYKDQLDSVMVKDGTKNHINLSLTGKQTRQLLRECNRAYNTQINDIFLTTLAYALYGLLKNKINYITLEGHGREDIDSRIDISRTVGWFTTMYPIRLEVYEDLGRSLKNIKETLKQIPNKGIGYGPLIGYTVDTLPKIIFNYLGQLDNEESYPKLQIHSVHKESAQAFWNIIDETSGESSHFANHDPSLINVNGFIINGILQFNISSCLDKKTNKKLSFLFKKKLKEIITHCLNKDGTEYTMSDFPEFEPYVLFNKEATKAAKEKNNRVFIFPPGNGGAESYFANIVPKLQNKELIIFNNYYLYVEKKLGKHYSSYLTYENLAENYIFYIKAIQPRGPYNLFGWSFGGVLAFEVANQLRQDGDTVSNLILIDPFFSYKEVAEKTNTKVSKLDINYKYNPKLYSKNWNTNLTLFKALKAEDRNHESVEIENVDKIYRYYAEKTTNNNLENLLQHKNFKVIAMNHDHSSWINDSHQIIEICSELEFPMSDL